MRRKIGLEFILVVSVALVAFLVGSFFLVRHNLNKVTELNLRYYLDIVKLDYESGMPESEIVDKYTSLEGYIRITFMDQYGNVTIDSSAEDLENHLTNTRPEFTNLGVAYIRESATLNKQMMYLAYQFPDTTYLRLAIPINSILPFLNDFIGLSFVIAVIIAVMAFLLSKSLISRTMAPFKELKTALNNVSQGKYHELLPVSKYGEINEILVEINDINQIISDNISSLNLEKQKIDFLLDHMNQGLCVLDRTENVVLVNNHLINLFHFSEAQHMYRNYTFLFRHPLLQQTIAKTYKTKSSATIIIEVEASYYSVSVSYIEKDWNSQFGILLIFSDVTMIKNIEILKRDFFANASHELKSPLTSIMGSSELIVSGIVKDPEGVVDLAARILEDSKRMSKLVLDMLTLSKYENYIPMKANIAIDLQAVVGDVLEKLEPLALARRIKIIDESEPIYMNANQEHMEQLIRNLAENSIQYGIDSGWVRVKLSEDDQKVVIEVTDNGIGIPVADQSRVFERFYRVDKARSKKSGGTGLGLSIVKHIALIYQASIEMESEEGKGTTITITFPKAQE